MLAHLRRVLLHRNLEEYADTGLRTLFQVLNHNRYSAFVIHHVEFPLTRILLVISQDWIVEEAEQVVTVFKLCFESCIALP